MDSFGKKKRGYQKFFVAFLTGLSIFYSVVLAMPLPARAQIGPVPLPTIVTEDIAKRQEQFKVTVERGIQSAVVRAAVNAVSYFMRKIAYETAVKLATARPGQKPLAFIKDVGKDIADAGKDAVGEAIGSLGEPFGLNLCAIPDPRLNAYLKIGLHRIYIEGSGGPRPRCEWQEVKGNWKNLDKTLSARYGNGTAILDRFNATVNVDQSDFGVALGAIAKLDRLEYQKSHANEVERIVNKGLQAVKAPISGDVKTPAAIVEQELETVTTKHQTEITDSELAGLYSSSLVENVLPMAAGVFLNTFANKLLDRTLNFAQGLFKRGEGGGGGAGSADDFYASGFGDNRRAAEVAFAALFTAPPTKEQGTYQLTAEFASCPDHPGLNNCVIDDRFNALLEVGRTSKPLTIREAMDQQQAYLDPNKPLISPRREFQHKDVTNCYKDGYCYSNIQKLRKARILPLGFEIAALKSDPDKPWTLGEVVRGFDECPGRFCHLIDPNWIVKAPETRCEAKVFGPVRSDDSSPFRREECVDVSTCILEGANGECLGAYGYCTKEKNIWRPAGESCPAQYATCKTYVNDRSSATVSYLARTLDYGICTAASVGCRAYSAEQVGGEKPVWVSSPDASIILTQHGRNQVLYLNERVNASGRCAADGCTAFAPAARLADGTGRFAKDQNGNYIRVQGNENFVHLKKSPDYLGCYDADITTPQIEWPKTKADVLNRIESNPACANYAAVCVEEEIACDGFIPKNGGPEIPAIVGQNTCDASCVGYDAYKQLATSFAPAEDLTYLVPSAGVQCQAAFVGCDEFTNIEDTAAGGEKKEYYTQVKYCQKPTGANEKVYYSWEGSAEAGFVLRTHRLLQLEGAADAAYIAGLGLSYREGDTAGTVFPAGSPAYASDARTALQANYNACNKEAYNHLLNNDGDPKASPDCRALYDETGRIFYRLLKETVTVSNDCRRLRKTESRLFIDADVPLDQCAGRGGVADGGVCKRCYGGGSYVNGSCVYQTIPGEAASCPAAANGCRAYSGNTGNVVSDVMSDAFEPVGASDDALNKAKEGWSGGSISTEATQVGLHSLRVDGANIRRITRTLPADTLQTGASYELSFWARGATQAVRIQFDEGGTFTIDPVTRSQSNASIGNEWRRYVFGPVQFSGDAGVPRSLVFESNGTSVYFLDNVILRELNDRVYLLKDKNSVPRACDANPSDGLPGQALGCRAYTNRAKQDVYTTGFSSLCRAEAIGCQPLYDTRNTLSGAHPEYAHAYNVWCPRAGADDTTCMVRIAGSDVGACALQRGSDGCYLSNVVEIPPPAHDTDPILPVQHVKQSTVILPPDTPSSAPIFLAADEAHTCRDFERGCMRLGAEEKVLPSTAAYAYSHTETLVINDPDKYANIGGQVGTLCQAETVGCEAWRSGATQAYFKDPRNSNQLCVYKAATEEGPPFGWFKKDVGQCSNNANQLCRQSSDCGEGNTCANIGSVPCADDNLANGEYGMWSNESDRYAGMVGICEDRYDQCTELLDVQDTSNLHPKGQPYDVIYDKTVTDEAEKCGGRVSLKEGCVLFDKTDSPNKIYNSDATYAASRAKSDAFVPANTAVGPFNANVILKVNRDRACAEWLACKSSIPKTDESGATVNLCYEYKACGATAPGVACTNWVDAGDVENPLRLRLTEDAYALRNTRWDGVDYSGYSLYDKYQISNLAYLTFNLRKYPNLQKQFGGASFIAYKADDRYFAPSGNGEEKNGCFNVLAGGATQRKPDWTRCGLDGGAEQGGGRCYNAQCIYPSGGRFPEGVTDTAEGVLLALQTLEGGTCKAFPETDSPYPLDTVLKTASVKRLPSNQSSGIARTDITESKRAFQGVNYCQDGNCSCTYQKVTYKSGARPDYWSTEARAIPAGVCSGGTSNGFPCNPDEPATPGNRCTAGGGTCGALDKKETHVGLDGYCLEYDRSRPLDAAGTTFACLTWLPIDVSVSGADVYNADTSAGYDPAIDAQNGYGQVYCANATNGGATDDSFAGKDPQIEFNRYFSISNGQIIPNNAMAESGNYAACERLIDSSIVASAFTLAACSQDPSAYYLPVAMQAWAWKAIGNSATVLRAELAPAGTDGKFSGTYIHRTTGVRVARHLLPTPESNFIESGVFLHPPRYWTGLNPVGPQFEYHYGYLNSEDVEGGQKTDRTLSTLYLSPGTAFTDFHLTDGNPPFTAPELVDRTSHEANIRDDSVEKIYFVPTLFPTGGKGVFPQILSTDVFIDIRSLRAALDAGQEASSRRVVPKAIRIDSGEKSGHFGGLAFVNPRESSSGGVKVVDAAVWSYALQRDQISGQLPKYWDYANAVANNINDAAGERNEIYRRYVVVFAGRQDGQLPEFLSADATIPASSAEDPFEAICQRDSENWFAIGMDFNNRGEFLGYISRWCQAAKSDKENSGIQLSVVASMPEQCTEIVQVYDNSNPLQETSNKAWTDRVWKYAKNIWMALRPGSLWTTSVVKKEDLQTPFGSLLLTSDDIPAGANDVGGLGNYRFWDYRTDGVPYACTDSLTSGLSLSPMCGTLKNFWYPSAISNQAAPPNVFTKEQAYTRLRNLFVSYFSIVDLSVNSQDISSVTRGNYALPLSDSTLDGSERYASHGSPPKIYSLNPAKCSIQRNPNAVRTGPDERCTPGEENNITIFDKNGTNTDYNGDGRADEDANGDGVADPVFASGSYTAIARFFTFADHNRMPIRRVMVDWQDGSMITNEGKMGLYKNRKPYCEQSDAPTDVYNGELSVCLKNNVPTGLTCKQQSDCATGEQCDAAPANRGVCVLKTTGAPKTHGTPPTALCSNDVDCGNEGEMCKKGATAIVNSLYRAARSDEYQTARFGDLPRACTSGYFEFVHAYTCGAFELGKAGVTVANLTSPLARQKLTAQGFGPNDKVCVFKPRVQVLDNWGWCTGVDAQGRAQGYYSESTSLDCNPGYNFSDGHNPWTAFRGEIIVAPHR